MGNSFFVAFEKVQDVTELKEIIYRMNAASARYESSAVGKAIDAAKVKLHDRDGYMVKNTGNDVCFGLLWRKYFALSHDEDGGIYFFDKEYEQKKNNIILVEGVTTA